MILRKWVGECSLVKKILPDLNFQTHCLYGTGIATPKNWIYGPGKFPDSQPRANFEDGDGTVNLRSLKVCDNWAGKQLQPVHVKQFPKQMHMGILSFQDFLDYVKRIVV